MNRLNWQWEENPMLPVLIFLSAGIYTAAQASEIILWLIGAVLSLACTLLWLGRNLFLRGPAVFRSLFAWCLCWGAGAGLTVFRRAPEELPAHSAVYGSFTGCGDLQENGSRRCLARIWKIRTLNGRWREVNEQAMLQIRGQAAAGFRSGHCFLSSITLRGIPAPALPGEFNARKWYLQQGIRWQSFGNASQIILTDSLPAGLETIAQNCRNSLESVFSRFLTEKDDAAMLSALLLGIRRKMDHELKDAYAGAGLTHILAVSGMHVALIYSFLSILLAFLKNLPAGRFIFSIVITAILWFYALVTGLSPSVLRAVTLFSVMQWADVLKKPSLPLNNLCFASILLLLAEEELLFDLGYQLSFAAVYGIISFQPALNARINARSRTGKFIAENASVTLAASLSTLPLILFHFHRFPVYFLLSNLIAVPFSNLLIYTGIALLLTFWMPHVPVIIAYILHGAIALLNGFVSGVNALPFSSVNHLYLSEFEAVLLLLSIIAFQIFLQSKKIFPLNCMLAFVLFSCILQLPGIFPEGQKQQFILNYRNEWFTLESIGSTGRIGSLNPGVAHPAFLAKGFQLKELVKDSLSRISLEGKKSGSRLCSFRGKSILLLNNYLKIEPRGTMPIRIDLLLVGKAGEKSLSRALKIFRPNQILAPWPEKQLKKFRKNHPGCPPVQSFRYQKITLLQP